MMNPDYVPILIIVAFVVYPFAVMFLTVLIVSRTRRERFPVPVAKLFAIGGCVPVAWFIFKYGLGKIPPVTVIGSAVFVLGAAATGGLVGAIADLLVPMRKKHDATLGTESRPDGDDDGNPYRPPESEIP